MLEHSESFVAIHSLNHHQPIDVIAVGAAAETMEVIGIDVQAGRAVGVKRAVEIAVD